MIKKGDEERGKGRERKEGRGRRISPLQSFMYNKPLKQHDQTHILPVTVTSVKAPEVRKGRGKRRRRKRKKGKKEEGDKEEEEGENKARRKGGGGGGGKRGWRRGGRREDSSVMNS